MAMQASTVQPAGCGSPVAVCSTGTTTRISVKRPSLIVRSRALHRHASKRSGMVHCAHEGGGGGHSAGGGGHKPPGNNERKRHGSLARQGGALVRRLSDTLGVRPFRDLNQIRNIKERKIGGRLWLLLLTFYGVYYAAYLYLVYKVLHSLPGVMPALERADDKAGWLFSALLDVGLWPWLAAALLLYIKAGVSHSDGDDEV